MHDFPRTACTDRRSAFDSADRGASVQAAQDEADAVQQSALAEANAPAPDRAAERRRIGITGYDQSAHAWLGRRQPERNPAVGALAVACGEGARGRTRVLDR